MANPLPDNGSSDIAVQPSKTSSADSDCANPTPFVIPSLQKWDGGKGSWRLSKSTRIVVDPAYASGVAADARHSFMANPSTLSDFAKSFQSDIKHVTGLDLEVAVSSKRSKDDIFLTLGAESKDAGLNNEGYHLDIGKKGIEIQAVTSRGAFWGTRTLLQMIILADESGYSLPLGHARDFPNYNERKFMQDIARKPIPMSDLKEYATLTSFYKYNTLHHHYNDNPGMQTKNLMPDWATKYSGFRLKSDNPVFAKYANNDTAYTKQDIRAFQDFIKARGLDLIPEIDTPAHSLCFTKFHPEWSIRNDTARGDWLDLGNQEVWTFVESLWTEFVGWFDSREISIGADEYDATKGDLARKFINHFHDFFGAKFNRTIRMWGSDVKLPGTIEINSSIHTDHWDWTYSNPVDLVKRGHKVSNLNAPDVYLVPRSQSYWDYLDDRKLYELWEPWVFDILDKTNSSRNLDPKEPLLTGGGFANWNDFLGESFTRVELYDRVSKAAGAVAEKLWTGSLNSDHIPYDKWAPLAKKLRENIPGITLTRRPSSKGQFVVSYNFEDGTVKDKSGNGYDGKLNNGATIVDVGEGHGKAVKLTPKSYISTPLESIRYPYAIGLWVKPDGTQKSNAVLLESGDGRLLISNGTLPRVTFEQDGHQYDTQIELPPGTWSHIAFSADGTKTSVFYNMRRQAILQYFNPRWDQLRNETLVATGPIRNIGSKDGNSVNGLVDGFFVLNRASYGGEMAFLGKHYANALP
ncbi:glycoside hydrolase [Martensiomyces pterosporus]|nr:glycoside hydrolase [Martensiomyces pterosporus]